MDVLRLAFRAFPVWMASLGWLVVTDVVQAFPLTIPANGTVNNIFFVDCELGVSNVSKILLTFPPGCAGQVGIRIEHGGAQVYPLKPGTFFIFDDFTLEIDVSGQSNSGQWHVAGYNTDVFPHTILPYFFYDYVDLSNAGSQSSLISL